MARKKYSRPLEGGRGDGNRGDGYVTRSKSVQFTPISLTREENQLASALKLLAYKHGGLWYDYETTQRLPVQRPIIGVSGRTPEERDDEAAQLEAAFVLGNVAFKLVRRADHVQRPEDNRQFLAEYEFNPKSMEDFICSPRVKELLDKMTQHESEESNKSSSLFMSDNPIVVPLSMLDRVALVELRGDCRQMQGLPRVAEEPMDHPRIKKHRPGGRGSQEQE